MAKETVYKCVAFSPFDMWRFGFLGFIVAFIGAYIVTTTASLAFFYSLILVLVYFVASILASFTIVVRNRNHLTVKSISGKLSLENVETVETWWSYEIDGSTRSYESGSQRPLRGHANKINVYAKFVSEDGELLLYEQIHLGEKFPNNHKYLPDININEFRLKRVWDIDKCLSRLLWSKE